MSAGKNWPPDWKIWGCDEFDSECHPADCQLDSYHNHRDKLAMSNRWDNQKLDVLRTAQKILSAGLVTGTSGNVSVRLAPHDDGRELLAITPSGRQYDTMERDDILVVDFDVDTVEGDLTPSTETLLHVAIYRARPDVGAVIHTHAVYSSVAAVAGLDIPPIIDEAMVVLGGPIMVSEYAFPSSEDLADNVCIALGERQAALIRNHGAVGVGHDAEEAFEVCILAERVAQIFVLASALGKVNPLPDEIIEAELAIFRMRNPDATNRSE